MARHIIDYSRIKLALNVQYTLEMPRPTCTWIIHRLNHIALFNQDNRRCYRPTTVMGPLWFVNTLPTN